MPKPPTHQRPIPINRNWSGGRPGAPQFGKPGKDLPSAKRSRKAPHQTAGTDKPDLQLDLKLPKLPFPKL